MSKMTEMMKYLKKATDENGSPVLQNEYDHLKEMEAKSACMRCYTCKHWRGNKVLVAERMAESDHSMYLYVGWPESGRCGEAHQWMTLTINGNATAEVAVTANFGCPYWVAEQKVVA